MFVPDSPKPDILENQRHGADVEDSAETDLEDKITILSSKDEITV